MILKVFEVDTQGDKRGLWSVKNWSFFETGYVGYQISVLLPYADFKKSISPPFRSFQDQNETETSWSYLVGT
jgi:hypothetical protein